MSPTAFVPVHIRESIEGPDITWVGQSPFAQGLCLGFDNGTILFTETGVGWTSSFQQVSESKEAINGVAAIGKSSLAVSTRADVTFLQLDGPAKDTRTVFPGGAHGVVSTQSGYFIAPLGMQGLLVVKPDANADQVMHVTIGERPPVVVPWRGSTVEAVNEALDLIECDPQVVDQSRD